MNLKQKLSWKFLLPVGIILSCYFTWFFFPLGLIGILMAIAGIVDLIKECKNNPRNISFLFIFIIIFLVLLSAPWMTSDWCKQRLIGYKFNGYRAVDESWGISTMWVPFGRGVNASLPESEAPPAGTPGGWGFMIFMHFIGDTMGATGR